MKTYQIKAYGEEYGLPNKTKIIEAESKAEAEQKAWCIFGEYDDISVSEVERDGI